MNEGQSSHPADQVRDYALRQYILPARAAGQPTVTILAGPIHKALGFRNRMPCVCDALGVKKFAEDHRVCLVKRSGPKHGASAEFIFAI